MKHVASVLVGTAVCVASVTLVCAASAQSLGDLARKEQERRKAVTTPGKVYTNDALHVAPAPPANPPASTPAPSQEAAPPSPSGGQGTKPGTTPPAADTVKADTVKKDEAYWRARLQSEREVLERAKVLVEALQSRVSALQTDFVNRDDPASRANITAERQRALAELDRTRKEIELHTKAVADIQEEGRRSGVPAAWYR